jgi:hypothetical protein
VFPRSLVTTTINSHSQVIVSFVATAYLTLAMLVVNYIFVFDPAVDPYGRDEVEDFARTRCPRSVRNNPIDNLILRKRVESSYWQTHVKPKWLAWERTINKANHHEVYVSTVLADYN